MKSAIEAFNEWLDMQQDLQRVELRAITWSLGHAGPVPAELARELAALRARAQTLFEKAKPAITAKLQEEPGSPSTKPIGGPG